MQSLVERQKAAMIRGKQLGFTETTLRQLKPKKDKRREPPKRLFPNGLKTVSTPENQNEVTRHQRELLNCKKVKRFSVIEKSYWCSETKTVKTHRVNV